MRLCTPRASGWIEILGQCDQGREAASSAAGAHPGQIVILFWPLELSGLFIRILAGGFGLSRSWSLRRRFGFGCGLRFGRGLRLRRGLWLRRVALGRWRTGGLISGRGRGGGAVGFALGLVVAAAVVISFPKT